MNVLVNEDLFVTEHISKFEVIILTTKEAASH